MMLAQRAGKPTPEIPVSVHVSSAVWRLQLESGLKIVLLKLADCADDQGRNAFPSVGRIARECCMHERSVQRALRRLEAAGLLEVQAGASQHRPTTYRVRTDRGVTLSPLNEGPGVTAEAPGVTSGAPGVTAVSPDPSLEPSKEPSEDDKGAGARSRAELARVYRDRFGHEPVEAQLDQLECYQRDHPPDCLEWALDTATGTERGWHYLRAMMGGCLREGHGPRRRFQESAKRRAGAPKRGGAAW